MATLGTFVAAQVLTAAELNAIGTWTTYTPTWTGTGGTPTLGNGTLVGYYTQLNDLVFVRVRLTWGSTTAAVGISEWRWSFPSGLNPTQITDNDAMGSATVLDSGTALYRSIAFRQSTSFGVYAADGAPSVGSTNPMTWTTNDKVSAVLTYSVA